MSVTILHMSDEHITTTFYGKRNPATGFNTAYESNLRALESAVRIGLERNVDAVVTSGDMFADANPSAEALLKVAETLRPLLTAGIPFVITEGNHTYIRLEGSNRTASRLLAELLRPFGVVEVVSRQPRLVRLPSGIQIAVMPWLNKPRVLAQIDKKPTDAAHGDRLVAAYGLHVIESMMNAADASEPLMLTSHVTVAGPATMRTGSEREMPTHLFSEPILPLASLDATPASYVGLGHIHSPQKLSNKTYYAGSLNRLTFADADDVKGVNLVTISDDNTLVSVERVPAHARIMQRLSLEDDLSLVEPGAIVELTLPEGLTDPPEDARAALEAAGAIIGQTPLTTPCAAEAETVILPETVTSESALRTWLATHHPNADAEKVVDYASKLGHLS